MDLLDDSASTAGAGIFGVAGEGAVERADGLARLALGQVNFADDALDGEGTRIARLYLKAQSHCAIWPPCRNLRLDGAQALAQRRLPHLPTPTSYRADPGAASVIRAPLDTGIFPRHYDARWARRQAQ